MQSPAPTGIFHKSLTSQPIDWQGEPIHVVSLGCGDVATISKSAQNALTKADYIYGTGRQLEEISHISATAEKRCLPSPFAKLRDELVANQDSKIALLASGDALFYGLGNWISRLINAQYLVFHPNTSSIQYCFHAIGLSWQQSQTVSLHGRPLANLRRSLKHKQLLAIFTDKTNHPQAIAMELCEQGFATSEVWVCEAMGSAVQQLQKFSAQSLSKSDADFHELNILVTKLSHDDPSRASLPGFPGIADALWSTGAEPGHGMISKREVRLTILSLMQPGPDEIAWDIGAGCGSVSVEWALWNPAGKIFAIEQQAERMQHIKRNSEKFGTVLNLIPVQGNAPDCLDDLPQPNCIFVGGSGGLETLLHSAWAFLPRGGKLIASAVSDDSCDALTKFFSTRSQYEQVCITVEKNMPGQKKTRMLRPVMLAKCVKDQ